MNLFEELKELSFQMMVNQTEKKQIENSKYYYIKTGNKSLFFKSEEDYQNRILNADKKGYELSLKFNELLLKNGKTFNSFTDNPDAANIEAENLLYTYGLHYPISWYIKSEDKNGLHYGYDFSDTIDKKHNIFLKEIIDTIYKQNLDNFTYKRLILAAEYYSNHRKLLSKYHNNEIIEKNKENTRH